MIFLIKSYFIGFWETIMDEHVAQHFLKLRKEREASRSEMAKRKREVGTRLRSLREERNMSRADMANRLGITQPALYYIESGKNCPMVRVMAAARIFGVTVDSLLEEPEHAAV
jgi:DNA-binding XRE family transcriptional regulator